MKTAILTLVLAALCFVPGSLPAATGGSDFSFSQPSANGPVFAVATTADGYIWMGGYFNSVNGSAHTSENYANLTDTYYCLAVLNTNGTLNANFTFSVFTNLQTTVNMLNEYYVSAIEVAPQNVVYAGFSKKSGNGVAFIARFVPVTGQPGRWTLNSSFTQSTLNHISGIIHSMAYGDDMLYVAASVYDNNNNYHSPLGGFNAAGALVGYTLSPGWGPNEIFQVRYYPAGAVVEHGTTNTWPSSFLLSGSAGVGDPATSPYPPVNGVTITCADKRTGADQASCPISGEILAGGAAAPYENYLPTPELSGFELNRMGGTLQTPAISAATNSPIDNGQNLSWVEALPDGDALIAGAFTQVHGYSVNNFAHVLADGSVDRNFNNNTGFGWVLSMAKDPDGKYLLCGEGKYTAPVFGSVYGWVERRELLPTNGLTFISQPQAASQIIYESDTASIYADASGWPGLLAQWRKNGGDLAGKTNLSLNLGNVTTNDSGAYSLFIQNGASCQSSAVSSNATLTVLPAPPAPANDAFANAIPLSGFNVNGTGTIRSATLETDEPDNQAVNEGRSVWWSWTAPVSGSVYVNVSDSDFQAAISFFTGNDVGNLTMVTNNYDYGNNCECTGRLSHFVFNVAAGTTYRIAIGGQPNSGSLGDILFSIEPSAASWIQNPSPTISWLYGVAAGNHRLVAVGDANSIITSADGANWSTDTVSVASSSLKGVTFGNGIFIVSGDGGTILTSPDGTNWTPQTSGTTDGLWSVVYGNGIFVVGGDNGTIVTSLDGVHWTGQTSTVTGRINGMAFKDGLFAAVDGNGEIFTSPDTTNWTQRVSPVSDTLWGITGGDGQFVAVGDYGDIITSPDGVDWTLQSSPASDMGTSLYNVSYGGGRFVTVGDYGTLLLSTDGTNWMTDDPGVSAELNAVTYYENGSFVIVGEDGLILFNSPPRLGLLPQLSNHALQFTLNGINGSTAVIEATPTLAPADWRPIATNVIAHGIVIFNDAMTNHSYYYRARVQ